MSPGQQCPTSQNIVFQLVREQQQPQKLSFQHGTTAKTVTKDIAVGETFYAKVKACTAIWCGDYSAEASFVMPAKPATPSILGIQLIITNP